MVKLTTKSSEQYTEIQTNQYPHIQVPQRNISRILKSNKTRHQQHEKQSSLTVTQMLTVQWHVNISMYVCNCKTSGDGPRKSCCTHESASCNKSAKRFSGSCKSTCHPLEVLKMQVYNAISIKTNFPVFWFNSVAVILTLYWKAGQQQSSTVHKPFVKSVLVVHKLCS